MKVNLSDLVTSGVLSVNYRVQNGSLIPAPYVSGRPGMLYDPSITRERPIVFYLKIKYENIFTSSEQRAKAIDEILNAARWDEIMKREIIDEPKNIIDFLRNTGLCKFVHADSSIKTNSFEATDGQGAHRCSMSLKASCQLIHSSVRIHFQEWIDTFLNAEIDISNHTIDNAYVTKPSSVQQVPPAVAAYTGDLLTPGSRMVVDTEDDDIDEQNLHDEDV